MLKVGARRPPTTEYPCRLTVWDMKGLLLNGYYFEEWKADNDLNSDINDKIRVHVEFWESNLPTLLDMTHEELREIFTRWGMLLDHMSGDV